MKFLHIKKWEGFFYKEKMRKETVDFIKENLDCEVEESNDLRGKI